jgi:hypothetical protein
VSHCGHRLPEAAGAPETLAGLHVLLDSRHASEQCNIHAASVRYEYANLAGAQRILTVPSASGRLQAHARLVGWIGKGVDLPDTRMLLTLIGDWETTAPEARQDASPLRRQLCDLTAALHEVVTDEEYREATFVEALADHMSKAPVEAPNSTHQPWIVRAAVRSFWVFNLLLMLVGLILSHMPPP